MPHMNDLINLLKDSREQLIDFYALKNPHSPKGSDAKVLCSNGPGEMPSFQEDPLWTLIKTINHIIHEYEALKVGHLARS